MITTEATFGAVTVTSADTDFVTELARAIGARGMTAAQYDAASAAEKAGLVAAALVATVKVTAALPARETVNDRVQRRRENGSWTDPEPIGTQMVSEGSR